MSAILYPVAANAERALAATLGRAARFSDAQALARGEVVFVSEPAGPAFDSYQAALAVWGGRIDDGKPGHTVQPADRYCTLREVVAGAVPRRTAKSRQAKPTFADGRRWSPPPTLAPTLWRLSVSYWRIVADEELAAMEQARKTRRRANDLDPATLQALARQPLQPVRPQQPLDIGLFEFRPPDAPHIVMPDE